MARTQPARPSPNGRSRRVPGDFGFTVTERPARQRVFPAFTACGLSVRARHRLAPTR